MGALMMGVRRLSEDDHGVVSIAVSLSSFVVSLFEETARHF
jgi:hypothetical protein